MVKKWSQSSAVALEVQAHAVAAGAQAGENQALQDRMMAGADTLQALARKQERNRKAAEAEPVLTLDPDASMYEVRTARQRRAVRHGTNVYLPTWSEATVGLPNSLLRSALFASTSKNRGFLRDANIEAVGDVEITMTGESLCDYDRKVFGFCLDHYRDRPLSSDAQRGADVWVQTTYYSACLELDLAPGLGVYRALRGSLLRLNAATLRVKIGRLNVPLPCLVEVVFEDGADAAADALRGSDLIAFRISESMANLFGPTTWTAVPMQALTAFSGLTGWLAAFYSTHRAPYIIKIDDLYQRTGVTCSKSEFRRMLRIAIDKLTPETVLDSIRVDRYVLTKDQLWLSLTRWRYRGNCPLQE